MIKEGDFEEIRNKKKMWLEGKKMMGLIISHKGKNHCFGKVKKKKGKHNRHLRDEKFT